MERREAQGPDQEERPASGSPFEVARRDAKRRGLRPLRLLCIPVLIAAAPSCQQPPETTLERARSEGFLRAGYSEEPPYAYFDESTGQVGGESPESLRAVARDLGIEEIHWVRLDFGDLIPALLQGRVDVVAIGMYPTAERERQVRFSVPTICSTPALLVPPGSTIRSIEDVVRDSALRVAVLHGSVEHSAVRALSVPASRILPVPDLTTGIVAVQSGSADAFAVTSPTARQAVQKLRSGSLDVRRYDPPAEASVVLAGCSALAFRPNDTLLVDVANEALRAYVGSGRHLRLLSQLGFAQEDLPSAGPPQE